MKISPFLRSFLQLFHNAPTDGGGGGGGGTTEGGGGGGGSDLVSDVLAAMPGGNLLLGDGGGEGGGTDDHGQTPTDTNGGGTPGAKPGEGGGADDWIARLPADVQAVVRERVSGYEGELRGLRAGQQPKPEGGQKKDTPAAKAPNPLAKLTTHTDLDRVEARAEQMREWAIANWDGGQLMGPDNTPQDVDAAQARQMFQFYDAQLRKHIPGRRAELDGDTRRTSEQERVAREAQTIYPWLGDKNSQEFAVFTKFKQAFPELLGKFDDAPLFIADMATGFLARKKAAAEKGKGGGKPADLVPDGDPVLTPAPKGQPGQPGGQPARPRVGPGSIPGGAAPGGSRTNGGGNLDKQLDALVATGGSRDGLVAFLTNLYEQPET